MKSKLGEKAERLSKERHAHDQKREDAFSAELIEGAKRQARKDLPEWEARIELALDEGSSHEYVRVARNSDYYLSDPKRTVRYGFLFSREIVIDAEKFIYNDFRKSYAMELQELLGNEFFVMSSGSEVVEETVINPIIPYPHKETYKVEPSIAVYWGAAKDQFRRDLKKYNLKQSFL